MHSIRHLRQFARSNPPPRHRRLRQRIGEAIVLVAIVDALGTVAMWLLEDEARRSQIHTLWDAFFFSTVQLLTVSSQMPNPVTTGGRIVDIFLEMTAICLVSGIAGAFASFFLSEEEPEDAVR